MYYRVVMNTKKFLKEKLIQIREDKNLSQSSLGKLCGVSQVAISQLESGETKNPSAETIEKLSKGLGITDKYFYLEDEQPTEKALPKNMPRIVRKFVMDQENIRWIQLGMTAKESAIPYETLKNLVENTKLPKGKS